MCYYASINSRATLCLRARRVPAMGFGELYLSLHQIIHKLPAFGLGVISIVRVKAFSIIHPVIDDVERIFIAVLQLIANDPIARMLREIIASFPANVHRN